MKTISQRHFRKNNAEVMREVEDGASFRVTKHGNPIAVVFPIEEPLLDAPTWREASGEMEFPSGVSVLGTTDEALLELRGQR